MCLYDHKYFSVTIVIPQNNIFRPHIPHVSNIFWQRVENIFHDQEKKRRVVEILLRYGLSVRDGIIYLGERVKVPYKSVAEEAGVDRRTVVEATREISRDEFLSEFFRRLRPAGPSMAEVARLLGYRCLTVEVYRDEPGILALVAGKLAERGINILQVVAEDPGLYKNRQKLYVVVSSPVPGDVIDEILRHPAVKRVSLS